MEALQPLLNFSDIQHLLWVKIAWFSFIVVATVIIFRFKNLSFYLISVGLFCGLSFFALVEGTDLLLFGLKGDEITIAAMYEMFAHGSLLSDFAYASLPPFYPPLWFQSFGAIGRFLNFHGVQIAKFASLSAILLFPIIFYLIGNYCSETEVRQKEVWFLSPLLIYSVVNWSSIITKPYELISAAFVILWAHLFLQRLHEQKLNAKSIILFGLTGGILFQIFYFWFFLVAIAIGLFVLFEDRTFYKLWQSIKVGIVTLITSIPYWLPLSLSYIRNGSENWQLGFWTLDILSIHPFKLETLTISSLILIIGAGTLLVFRNTIKIRTLLTLAIAPFVWYLASLFTLNFFKTPLQVQKGFEFFVPVCLAIAAGYGFSYFWDQYELKLKDYRKGVYLLATLILSTQLIFGTYIDQDRIQKTRVRAKNLDSLKLELKSFIEKEYPNIENKTVLHTGMPKLHAFLPVSDFIYFNQHNSHPAANFSARKRFLENLTLLDRSEEFYQKIRENQFDSIDLFIFYKKKEDHYPVVLHLDNFPHKFRKESIKIPKELIDEKYFNMVYENKNYIIFEAKAEK